MKKISKLVLNQIAKKELTQRQQGFIKGGRHGCTCGCCYAGSGGGSSQTDNWIANCEGGSDGLQTNCPTSLSWC